MRPSLRSQSHISFAGSLYELERHHPAVMCITRSRAALPSCKPPASANPLLCAQASAEPASLIFPHSPTGQHKSPSIVGVTVGGTLITPGALPPPYPHTPARYELQCLVLSGL